LAVAVHDPSQSALHLVVQVAIVETDTQLVLHLSSQQAPHDALQSVEDDEETDPSSDVEEDVVVHDALQPAWHRVRQSVVQSNIGGLFVHEDEHCDWQLDVQAASADAVHCALNCCSSLAAHACSQLAGAHRVVQSFWTTSEHCAFVSISMFPQSLTTAAFAFCTCNVTAAKRLERTR